MNQDKNERPVPIIAPPVPEYRPQTHGLCGTPRRDIVAAQDTPNPGFQEYPKHVNLQVENADEQKAALADGFSGDTIGKDFPKTFTKIVNEPSVAESLEPPAQTPDPLDAQKGDG